MSRAHGSARGQGSGGQVRHRASWGSAWLGAVVQLWAGVALAQSPPDVPAHLPPDVPADLPPDVPSDVPADVVKEDVSAIELAELPLLPELPLIPSDPASLQEATEAPDEVVVGAARREQSLGNVASAVTVISGDRLRRFGYRTVAEAIAAVAGVHLVDDRLSTRVGIRGLQPIGDFNTRILVIIDGTSMTEAWSHLSGVGYDLPVSVDEIERIEVIRGPVSSIYGTNAFLGIINIITREALAKARAWGRATAAQIGGAAGSAGFATGTPDRQVRGAVSFAWRRGEDLDYLGVSGLGRDKDRGLSVTAALSAALGATFAQIRVYSSRREIPFAPYDGDLDVPYTQTNRQLVADVSHTRQWGRLQMSGRLFTSVYRFDDRASKADGGGPLLVVGEARTLGADLRGRYQVLDEGRLDVTGGIEASYNDTGDSSQIDGDVKNIGEGLRFDLEGFYAELESAPTSWLGISAGLRLDRHSEFSKRGRLSPRLALFLSRDDRVGLKLLYAEGFRNPSTYEAYFTDGDDVLENRELEPESIRSFELVGWARPTPATSLRASAYRWDAFDIMKQLVVDMEEGDGITQFQYDNKDQYASAGLEFEGRFLDSRGWLAFAGVNLCTVTSVEVSTVDPGSERVVDLAGAPRVTASFGVSSPLLPGGWHASSELLMIGSRPNRDGAERSPAHVTWNAVVYLPSWRGFDLTVGARNLMGIREQVPAAEDFDREDITVGTVPGEGRELYVRLGRSLR